MNRSQQIAIEHQGQTADLPLFNGAGDIGISHTKETRGDAIIKIRSNPAGTRTKKEAVYLAIEQLGSASFQEISRFLGWTVNRIIPRVDELRKAGRVVPAIKRQCTVTGHDCQTWTVARKDGGAS